MDDHKKNSRRGKTFSSEDVSLFCSQVALILKSAIPLADGIGAIKESVADETAVKMIDTLEKAVMQGIPFYEALRSCGRFPDYMVNMIEIGEKAGKLDQVMESLAGYYEREDQLKKSVRSAILYPFVLVVMMLVVIAVLVIKVLPVFSDVFRDLGGSLSDTARVVLSVSANFGIAALVVLLALIVLFIAGVIVSKTQAGSRFFTGFFERFGSKKGLAAKVSSARFASVMSMMLSSGYSVDEAFKLIPNIITNQAVKEKVAHCAELLGDGASFPAAIEEVDLFPGVYGRMVGIGTKTGNLDSVMQKMADLYEQEVDASVNRMVAVIEPVLVGVLSVVIGAILLSVMLPLMGVMSSIG